MISPEVFSQSLLNLSISVSEFSRISGIDGLKLRNYSKKGVPDKDTEFVIQMLTSANQTIPFGKQMDIEDY